MIFLYRLTHIDNIPHILQYGITHRNSPNHNPNYRNIGDTSLINVRCDLEISIKGHSYLIGDYIPFYFGKRMPMLLEIQTGYNVDRTPPEDIIYTAVALDTIVELSKDIIFSDGHARNSYTTFYDYDDIGNINCIIDWAAVNAHYWGGEENLDIKRRKQAELLTKGDIPPSAINMFGCYNKTAKERLVAMGINEEMIRITAESYF